MNLKNLTNSNRKRKALFVFTVFMILFMVESGTSRLALGSTYTFTQASWTGGVSANTAVHPTNVSGWNEYIGKDSSLIAGSTLTLSSQTTSVTQTSDTDFSSGTASSVSTIGSGSSADLTLSKIQPSLLGESSAEENPTTNPIGTTSGINTTGSSLLVMAITAYETNACAATVTDSKNNNWTQLTNYSNSGGLDNVCIWYVKNPVVGNNHTFSAANNNAYVSIFVSAWAGTDTASPFDIENGAGVEGTGTTIQPGSITPSQNNELIISATAYNSLPPWAVDSGFNILNQINQLAYEGGADAYLIQTTPVTVNPTWTANFSHSTAVVAAFKSSNSYVSSGTFTSSIIPISSSAWNTLSWTGNAPASTSITIKARSSNSATMGGAPDFSSCSVISNGAALSSGNCVTNGDQYIQYQASLTTSNPSNTPTLSDITVSYYQTRKLISSAYDSGQVSNTINQLAWNEDPTLPSGTGVTVSLRTAANSNGFTGPWTDFTNATSGCSKVAGTVTCSSSAIPSSMKDGSGDEWFEYKVALKTSNASTPTVSSVSVRYVVNAPPEFNPDYPATAAGGVSVSQVSDPSDPNYGKVKIQYSIKDPDTTTGTFTPGYVTPSFQYNIGGSWTTITSPFLNADALDNDLVLEDSYTVYTVYWDAKSQILNNYLTTAEVRVGIDDNEATHNTATATSANFILDTKDPTGTMVADVSAGTISLNLSDNTNIQYILSNDDDPTIADGVNSTSGEWQTVNTTSLNTTIPWIFSTSLHPTVNAILRDEYGNTKNFSIVAPSIPTNFFLKDVSNIQISDYREFVSWSVFSPTTSSTFGSYLLYRSTDGTNFSLVATVTPATQNYYQDSSLSTTTVYSYKVKSVDSDGDVSAFSNVLSDTPNGTGGTDVTPPTISNVTTSAIQSTSATITWDTDKISTSSVAYSPGTTYDQSVSISSYISSGHSVNLTDLTPNTTYYYKVSSTDFYSNTATDDNGGNGYSFTTSGGPLISDVTTTNIDDKSATVFWKTDRNSSSLVDYSTDSSLANSIELGTTSLVGGAGPTYQHTVNINGLAAGVKYYFFVKSTDTNGNTTTDDNSGNYYNFSTTLDVIPPVITNVDTPVLSSTAAVFVWTTDEPSDSQVQYGLSTGSYSSSSALDSTLTTGHVVAVTGLTPNTDYFYVVQSTDAAGNLATSPEKTFATPDSGNTVVTVNVIGSSGNGGGGGNGNSSIVPDTTPPIISPVTVNPINTFDATVNYTTNEDAVTFVTYGTDISYGFQTSDSDYGTNHTIHLTNLRMGTTYHFEVKAIDKSGNASQETSDATFQTKFLTEGTAQINSANLQDVSKDIEDAIQEALPSIVAPFINTPTITDITGDSATVEWKTNVDSYSVVDYATDAEFQKGGDNPYSSEVADISDKVSDHTLKLTNLTSNTEYHVLVKSFRFAEVMGKGNDTTFITQAGPIQPTAVSIKPNSFIVTWTTDEPTDSIVQYKDTKTGDGSQVTQTDKKSTHEVEVDNLTPGTTYQVLVSGHNSIGNLLQNTTPLTVETPIDSNPPQITNFTIQATLLPQDVGKAQAVVGWTTDKPSSSEVDYDEGLGSATTKNTFSQKIVVKDQLVTNHLVVVPNLIAGSIYRIQVISTDQYGNTAQTPVRTIIIPQQAQSVFDLIFKNFQDTFQFLK